MNDGPERHTRPERMDVHKDHGGRSNRSEDPSAHKHQCLNSTRELTLPHAARMHVTALQGLAAPLLQKAPGATSCMDP